MPIFSRQSNSSPPGPPARVTEVQGSERVTKLTHVATGSKISGLVSGVTEVLIDGEIDGEVKLDGRLVVGRQGKMQGNVSARAVQIAGHVKGDVHGVERVELLASATLEGDVLAPRVIIAEGAFFQGKIEMKGDGNGKEKRGVPRSLVASEGSSKPGGRPKAS